MIEIYCKAACEEPTSREQPRDLVKMAATTVTNTVAVTSENPSEEPPSEDKIVLDKLAEGIFGILGPSVNEIDDRVKEVR